MSSYKLTYFPARGRGELIRMVLSYGEIPFEDNRLNYKEWPEIKPNMPFAQVPILEIDGRALHQSNAICRYLAGQVGLAGSNDFENLEIDSAVDTLDDIRNKLASWYREKHPEAKEQKYKPVMEAIDFIVKRLDDQVKRNNGYLANGKLSWADIFFVSIIDSLNHVAKRDLLEDADNLKFLNKRVLEIPQIKLWVEKRPKSIL